MDNKGFEMYSANGHSCNMMKQGFPMGACNVKTDKGKFPACQVTLRERNGALERLIHAIQLSRPENYLSIYQSGCNLTCRKCHSASFSKVADGKWFSPLDILHKCMEYESRVTLWEPREKATAWHAHDTCRCCGSCILRGVRPDHCPNVLDPSQIVMSPQGWGPARNIVGFTGGDLTCRPEFYMECARLIKERTSLWVLIETNGYGLTPSNLNLLRESGIDAFWLDIKAFNPYTHRWLTGADNSWILKVAEEILKRHFVLEVLSLFIPGLVEEEELGEIAGLLSRIAPDIPFTILAFFPEHRMKSFRPPRVEEMTEAYNRAIDRGLRKVRLGNIGVFIRNERDLEYLRARVKDGCF